MENKLDNMEDILRRDISGFHQYILTDPVHLSYVSDNLCSMAGVRPEELLSDDKDRYMELPTARPTRPLSGGLGRENRQPQPAIAC